MSGIELRWWVTFLIGFQALWGTHSTGKIHLFPTRFCQRHGELKCQMSLRLSQYHVTLSVLKDSTTLLLLYYS